MEKDGTVESESRFNELKHQLQQQILTAVKGFSPAVNKMVVEFFPAVTKSMRAYMKRRAEEKASGAREKKRFWNFRKETEGEKGLHIEEAMGVESDIKFSSRASLPPLNAQTLKLMKDSVFHKILKWNRNNSLVIIREIMEKYDLEKGAFFIGNRWCVLCEHEVAFLLGLKPGGIEIKPKFKRKGKAATEDIPKYLIDLATSVKLDPDNKLLLKGTLEFILKNVKITEDCEEYKDSVKKLIYFFLLNFVLFPKSTLSGRKMFFNYDIKDVEETNWGQVIHHFVISDTCAFKRKTKIDGPLNFFPPVLEAWFFYRTNSFEKVINDNPDEAPISLCLRDSETRPSSSRLSVANSTTCNLCRDKEEMLSTESESHSKKKVCRAFSFSSEPLVVEVQQSIAVQVLRFCLDHVKQTLEEEEEGESEDELLHSMKDDLLEYEIWEETLGESNWAWGLLTALATTTIEEPRSEEVHHGEQLRPKKVAKKKKKEQLKSTRTSIQCAGLPPKSFTQQVAMDVKLKENERGGKHRLQAECPESSNLTDTSVVTMDYPECTSSYGMQEVVEDQAVETAPNLKEDNYALKTQNSKLKKENIELRREIDELRKQLSLNLKENTDLRKSLKSANALLEEFERFMPEGFDDQLDVSPNNSL